ncbi:MAG: DUF445 family protein [Tissierellia bacterium]|nr:DUF445 family protein [Tissierellia bacterium]
MKFIIPIFVGAVIGYITNWLAIKMLFRPHEEKRIFGFHIPFTPGLIPKERARIAKSVGEAVGYYLLSPEVVMKSIPGNKVEKYVNRWITSNIDKLRNDKRSIKSFLVSLSAETYERIFNKVEKQIVDSIYSKLKSDKFKQKVMDLIKGYILNSSMEDLYKFLDGKMETLISEFVGSKETKNLLKSLLESKLDQLAQDERKLNEIIPEDFVSSIKNIVKDNDERIVYGLKEILEDPNVETKIKDIITDAVSQNMNTLVALFVSPETISNKVYGMIKGYIDKGQIRNNLVGIFDIIIDKVLDNRVDSVFKNFKFYIGEEDILNITDNMLAYISKEENKAKILNIIDERLKDKDMEIKNTILDLLSYKYDKLISSDAFYNKINEAIDSFIENILNKPTSLLVANIDETIIGDISNLFIKMLNYFIENQLPHIVKLFNISKVVEDQINSYDVAFTEELILEIASRELKAITWLGAFLGGIIGILTPLLDMLY